MSCITLFLKIVTRGNFIKSHIALHVIDFIVSIYCIYSLHLIAETHNEPDYHNIKNGIITHTALLVMNLYYYKTMILHCQMILSTIVWCVLTIYRVL